MGMKTLTQYINDNIIYKASYITENIDMNSVKLKSKTFKEIMAGFYKLGYDYYGTMYWTNKTINNQMPDGINKFFDKLYDIEKNIFGDVQVYPHSGLLDIYVSTNNYDYDSNPPQYIFDWTVSEQVIKFKDQDKNGVTKTYYCFWNPKYKYFYFINIKINSARYINGYPELETLFNRWIEIKTAGIDELQIRYKLEKAKQDKEEDLHNKTFNKVDEYTKQYNVIIKDIKEDYKKHKDKYKELQYKDLAKKIKDDINAEIPFNKLSGITNTDCEKYFDNIEYFVVKEKIYSGIADDTYRYIINNQDLTDGYVYYITDRNKWGLD